MTQSRKSDDSPFLVSRSRRARRAPDANRERLYRVALRRIRNDGFDDTTVSAITRESDVAKGTFFNHFPTKEHLLARVLDEMMEKAFRIAGAGGPGPDAIAGAADALALEFAGDPPLARAIVPRLALLPPPPSTGDDGRQGPEASGSSSGTPGLGEAVPGPERLRRWIRDQLLASLRVAVPLEETDDQTLSVLLLAAFEVTVREWLHATNGEPPFPRKLLHGRIAYLLASAGFPRPSTPS
jgi:AcrR family transcriptional regulator